MGHYTLTLIAPGARYCECGRLATVRVGVMQMSAQVAGGGYGGALHQTLDLCGCCYRVLIEAEGGQIVNGTIETAQMTLGEVQAQIAKWEAQLASDRAQLAAHRAKLGDLALRGQAAQAAREIEKLELAVSVSEAALEAARRQEIPARRRRIADRIAKLTADAETWEAEETKWTARYNELEPSYLEARAQMYEAAHRAQALRDEIMHRDLDLKNFDRTHGQQDTLAAQPQHKNGVTA